MKKIYLYFLLSLPVLSTAQTILQSDLPTAGDAFTMGTDSNYVSAIPAGGMGQTWNYAGLLNLQTDTTAFVAASGTPYASSFSGSTLASFDPSANSYVYFTSNSSGFYLDGMADPSNILMYNPQELFIPVPFSYGNTRNNASRIQIDTTIVDSTGSINFRLVLRNESVYNADGSGTLTIPSGTFPNVLRVKITSLMYDSIYFDPTGLGFYVPFSGSVSQSTSYRFLSTGLQVNYLMGLEADSLGTTSISSEYLVDPTLSIPKINENKAAVAYPNPAFSHINFKDLTENTNVVVFDVNGKEIMRSKEVFNKPVSVESLPNGVYFYEIDQRGKIQKGSFVIQH